MNRMARSLMLLVALAAALGAQAPRENPTIKPIPPPGIEVPEQDRAALEEGLSELARGIEQLRANKPAASPLADVEIYDKAVRSALRQREFFTPADIEKARKLLVQGRERARLLARGESPWQAQPGAAALAYISEIDGSVQPYGLYIPAAYTLASPHRWRLDVWLHGRSETLSEVNFLDQVQRGGGPFVPPDTFVLQPYGRYCNANKFAGETDLFEALADVKRRFKIDENRIVIRGFSMGGAACWHFAAHHASNWAAAAPGAGFAETAEYLQIVKQEPVPPEWWERKLWQLYDCPVYAANFFNVPVVAYSGEIDRQKQAADVMSAALLKEGIPLVHIIGPQTAHSYHPASKVAIDMRIDAIAAAGRNPVPRRVRLVTPTLKYNRQAWVQVDALARHWETAHVEAELVDDRSVQLQTRNVTSVTLSIPPGHAPF